MKYKIIEDELIRIMKSRFPIPSKSTRTTSELIDKIKIQKKRAENLDDILNKILSDEKFSVADNEKEKLRKYLSLTIQKLITGQI